VVRTVCPASINGRRVVARRAPLDSHQPPAPCRPYTTCLSSHAHEWAIYGTTDPCRFQTDDTRLQGRPDAATAALPSRRALDQVEAQQRRTRCVPLPCLSPLLWLALASSLSAQKCTCSLGLLLDGVRLLTGPHAGEGWGREGERGSGEPSSHCASTLEAATPYQASTQN
jgi:hypothetical protein